MRLINLFATETDSDGKGHFNADDVCSVALLKHGTTRSYVDMQMAEGKHLRGWVTRISTRSLTERRRLRSAPFFCDILGM